MTTTQLSRAARRAIYYTNGELYPIGNEDNFLTDFKILPALPANNFYLLGYS
jgi:hypothetical protein